MFRSPNQANPLDFGTDDFYPNRRAAVDARLDEIETMTDEDLDSCVRDTWERHFGVVSRVNWDLFSGGADQIVGLLGCLSRTQLRGICERLVKHHRHTRSGFPDLTLWDPDRKECIVVEVKGPNDRLSDKQV